MICSSRCRPRLLACLAALAWASSPAPAWSWGFAVHHYIAQNYSKHLPATMDGLAAYDGVVDAHITDPDTRRPSTPGEEYRHYIDVDFYPEFLAGSMPHDRTTLEAQYGAATVLDVGIVPWAVAEVVETLTAQFQSADWSAAALTIADLCHYVGDASQPLHCTQNYNGQYTGNTGIHSRYESTMMNTRIGELSTPVMPIAYYNNPVDAMFGIVSGSWDQLDAVLAADNLAKAASGGSFNTTYYNVLWANTQTFTRARIDSAAVATASFVHTAWVDAGRPAIPGSSAGVEPEPWSHGFLEAAPSPFRNAITIRYGGSGPLTVDVYDVSGRRLARVVDGIAGQGVTSWRPESSLEPGLYFLRLTGAGIDVTTRIARLR